MSMNPQIQTVEVGVKELQKVTIYPLSMADQFKLSDIIANAITEYSDGESKKENALLEWKEKYKDDWESHIKEMPEQSSDVEMFQIISSAIQENLITILDLITETEKAITLDDMTNDQFAELCEVIYSVNYESAMGKLQALFQRAKNAFQLKKPSLKSSLAPVTGMNTSTGSPSETEE